MECASLSNILSSISTIFGILLLVSEMLPYASSSKCNSIIEGVSHVFCQTSCLVSNKNIRFENEELKQEVVDLKDSKKSLVEEINYLKKVVLTDLAADIQQLRKSFDLHRGKARSDDDNEIFIDV
jgi:hypothetical protein